MKGQPKWLTAGGILEGGGCKNSSSCENFMKLITFRLTLKVHAGIKEKKNNNFKQCIFIFIFFFGEVQSLPMATLSYYKYATDYKQTCFDRTS